jgi:hypothetical protein
VVAGAATVARKAEHRFLELFLGLRASWLQLFKKGDIW